MKLSGIEITDAGPTLPKKVVVRWMCERPAGGTIVALILVIDVDRVADMRADFAFIRTLPSAKQAAMVERFRLLSGYHGPELAASAPEPAIEPGGQASLF